jgi:hypothetical protein
MIVLPGCQVESAAEPSPLIQIKPSGRASILPLALGRERSPSGDGMERLLKFSIAAVKGVLIAEWTALKGAIDSHQTISGLRRK